MAYNQHFDPLAERNQTVREKMAAASIAAFVLGGMIAMMYL